MDQLSPPQTLKAWNDLGKGFLPGLLGIEIHAVDEEQLQAGIKIKPSLCAPNGYLHAATVVALADTACGYATIHNLPEGAQGFTTIELKTNFLGTALKGRLQCTATRVHKGRTTQVWDAKVRSSDTGKTIALFRCTQMILWPKEDKA